MRKIFIRLFFRWSAGRSDASLARLLHKFSLVEADSAWQMLRAMEAVDDPAYRAELFNNALEEVHHAYLFRRKAISLTDRPFTDDFFVRKEILDGNGKLLKFKVAHYLGEKDVYEQFLSYARAVPDQEVRELFLDIRGDEEEHQRKARMKLIEELGSESALKKQIVRARLGKLYDGWIELGKAMGNVTFSVLFSVVYLLAGIFFSRWSRRYLKDPQTATHVGEMLLVNNQHSPKSTPS